MTSRATSVRETSSAPERIQWVDASRGAAVLAIVAFHVLRWDFLLDRKAVWEPAGTVWYTINTALGRLRIPLLLLISGWMTASSVTRGLRHPRTVRRIVTGIYIYLVWLVGYALVFRLLTGPLPHRIDSWTDLARQVVVPNTTLWYVFALVIYLVAAASLRRLPSWLVIGGAFAVSLACEVLLPGSPQATKIGKNWIYFVLGSRAAPLLARVDSTASWTRLCGLVLAAVAAWHVRDLLPHSTWVRAGHGIAFHVVLLAAVVVGMALVCRWQQVRRPLASLGRRTLVVYLIHPVFLYLWLTVTAAIPVLVDLRANPLYAIGAPVILIAAIVALSLAFHTVTDRRARWLYEPPQGLVETANRILRTTSPPR